jgi:hypothetical protein
VNEADLDRASEQQITVFFVNSGDSFNGLSARALLKLAGDEAGVRSILKRLVAARRITCAFASASLNPHIKRLPDPPTDVTLRLLDTEDLAGICAYPLAEAVMEHGQKTAFSDQPFGRRLYLGEAQLAFVTFDTAVLERYANDPRYEILYNDYMGSMSITNEYFESLDVQERDKVSIQTFGLGMTSTGVPVVVAFLRYLANLSPEHQRYWESFVSHPQGKMLKQYYESSFAGEFWKNRSVRYAIFEEIRVINELTQAIYGAILFRTLPSSSAIDLTSFVRPTKRSFDNFILSLDKLLSENIDEKFFAGIVSLDEEIDRGGGRYQVRRKGSITLLEEWLFSQLRWSDVGAAREAIIRPLRDVRRLRQTPAHAHTADEFSDSFYKLRRDMLWRVFNSLSNIRGALKSHPKARSVEVPDWLDNDEIDVF